MHWHFQGCFPKNALLEHCQVRPWPFKAIVTEMFPLVLENKSGIACFCRFGFLIFSPPFFSSPFEYAFLPPTVPAGKLPRIFIKCSGEWITHFRLFKWKRCIIPLYIQISWNSAHDLFLSTCIHVLSDPSSPFLWTSPWRGSTCSPLDTTRSKRCFWPQFVVSILYILS